jgi:hypothetical protein
METIKHEGKTYCKQPATNLCVGCDFWNDFKGHTECHAPNELQCGSSIYKEVTEVENYADAYDQEYQFISSDDLKTMGAFVGTILLLMGLVVATAWAVINIIINNYK